MTTKRERLTGYAERREARKRDKMLADGSLEGSSKMREVNHFLIGNLGHTPNNWGWHRNYTGSGGANKIQSGAKAKKRKRLKAKRARKQARKQAAKGSHMPPATVWGW